MRLSEVCIERPVLATVMSLLILLFGAIALTRLPNRELPNVDPPVVSVATVYPGAAPEVIETSVTQPIEDEIMGIAGIRHVTSVSREQVSAITAEFELSHDVDEAANDVRDRVARAKRSLPEDVEEPIVSKRDADARPVLWLALAGEGYDQLEISKIAETRVQDRLANLPGVANVIIAGERRMAMRLWIDNGRLTSHGLTVSDVGAALARENVDLPSGRIEGAKREFTVRTLGELRTARDFEEMVVAKLEGAPVRLRDVARVEVGPEDERKLIRFNGQPAVGLGVVKLSRANTLSVTDAVRAEIESLQRELPDGVELVAAWDSSIYIRRSMRDVTRTLFEAVALVTVVIYLFLRTLRSTVVPATAIPISIVGTFAVLYFAGFSINTLTLMGLTLAIGLVVDDAIVVLENITRWVEEGTPPREAAQRGMKEISFAVVASTVSVVAVFLPLAFLTDTTGKLFREFGVTVAAAVGISGFVALTLSPALCARVLHRSQSERGLKAVLARGFEALAAGYAALLRLSLARRSITVAVGVAWFGLGLLLVSRIDREFVPTDDRGSLFIRTEAPEGSTLDYTDHYQRRAEAIVEGVPEIARIFSVVALGIGTPGSVNEGFFFCSLTPWEKRNRKNTAVVEELREKLRAIPGISAQPFPPPPLGQSFGSAPVSLVLQGPDSQALAIYAREIMRRAPEEIPGLVNLNSDLILNKPQLEVSIERDRASDLGVSVREIAATLQTLLGGQDLSTFKLEGETYDVIAQLEQTERSNPKDLLGLFVHGREDRLIPLASLVRVGETTAPRALPHFDRVRSATVTGHLTPGVPLGETLDRIRSIAEETIPREGGYRVAFSGASEEFYESGHALVFAYLLAVLIVYLVLAAQFESFLHPFTILVAAALSYTGALLTLEAFDQTLNLYSRIGLVMLVGLVTKNAILIVEFANQLQRRGRGLFEAVLQASRIRFRPILMTAISTIIGIFPIAMPGMLPEAFVSSTLAQSLGLTAVGGESRASLGIAVVGGMFFSSALTIFIVPATYLAVESLRMRLAPGEQRLQAGAPSEAVT